MPRNYVGGITQIVGGLESMFAQPSEVGTAVVKPVVTASPAAVSPAPAASAEPVISAS
ncbi:MAG: hypothetical protein HQK97_04620 [Nitrospirae bacterium]|nr:hypothetical protein [Nitrospirota bacterium]